MTISHDNSPVFGSRFEWLCKGLALVAGLILVAMSLITVVSVLGRYFFGSPIMGDSEIVQMLTGVVVALSFPYCHLRYGNVIVDVFTAHASPRFKASLDIVGSLLLALLALLLAWQTSLGAVDAYNYGNETMMLRMKEWWFYILIAAGMYLLGIAGFIVTWRHVIAWRLDQHVH
jgi:TRAP-type C4-dicarboxylate transport system permease small subunit